MNSRLVLVVVIVAVVMLAGCAIRPPYYDPYGLQSGIYAGPGYGYGAGYPYGWDYIANPPLSYKWRAMGDGVGHYVPVVPRVWMPPATPTPPTPASTPAPPVTVNVYCDCPPWVQAPTPAPQLEP